MSVHPHLCLTYKSNVTQFLSHDGITTFSELCDAQQNAFNVNYDLAVILATLGVGLSGDPITTKLSIGCNANAQTADPVLKLLGANEQGLNGHNVRSTLPTYLT
jgi:hypothetical protein